MRVETPGILPPSKHMAGDLVDNDVFLYQTTSSEWYVKQSDQRLDGTIHKMHNPRLI
ncbi:unnamed protein product [Periconia digitata]|uniref:Uncharacterized protein n=1 Tax=Periconia digitata TaxID=1303443 RepID=A0A9W4XHK1_9PLEO|nr:unnamed protein product [Periconia digitata]